MQSPPDHALRTVAFFKLFKGLLLLALAIGIVRCLHRDLAEILTHWVDLLQIDPGNRYAAALLAKAGLLTGKNMALLSGLTFSYAGVFLTEGVGLYLQKRWAEWLTIITTASLIPFEIHELAIHFSVPKMILLAINLAVVAYLIWRVRRKKTPLVGRQIIDRPAVLQPGAS